MLPQGGAPSVAPAAPERPQCLIHTEAAVVDRLGALLPVMRAAIRATRRQRAGVLQACSCPVGQDLRTPGVGISQDLRGWS